MAGDFSYFDGREYARHEVREGEMDGVKVERETAEVTIHADGRRDRTALEVWPPYRVCYPRRVESLAEARALYTADEISLAAFEDYAERLLADAPLAPV